MLEGERMEGGASERTEHDARYKEKFHYGNYKYLGETSPVEKIKYGVGIATDKTPQNIQLGVGM